MLVNKLFLQFNSYNLMQSETSNISSWLFEQFSLHKTAQFEMSNFSNWLFEQYKFCSILFSGHTIPVGSSNSTNKLLELDKVEHNFDRNVYFEAN